MPNFILLAKIQSLGRPYEGILSSERYLILYL